MEKLQNSKDGLILIDKNKYGNIIQVTHTFQGNSSVEDAIRSIVLSKVKDKSNQNNCLTHSYYEV